MEIFLLKIKQVNSAQYQLKIKIARYMTALKNCNYCGLYDLKLASRLSLIITHSQELKNEQD